MPSGDYLYADQLLDTLKEKAKNKWDTSLVLNKHCDVFSLLVASCMLALEGRAICIKSAGFIPIAYVKGLLQGLCGSCLLCRSLRVRQYL